MEFRSLYIVYAFKATLSGSHFCWTHDIGSVSSNRSQEIKRELERATGKTWFPCGIGTE
jgi:hypothetical protein